MNEICIRSKDEVLIMDISEINEENLFQKFIEKPAQAVYVIENHIVIGMITRGDLARNVVNGRRLITTEFTKVGLKNEKEAQKILENKKWMDALPVIGDDGQIEKEYYRPVMSGEASVTEDYIVEVVSQIICEINYLGTGEYKKIVCLTDRLTNSQIQKLQQQCADDKVEVTDSLSIKRIRQCADENVCICEIFSRAYRVRSVFYQKFGVDSFEWDVKEKQAVLFDRACHFKAVAVFEKEKDYFCGMINAGNTSILEEKYCIWNDKLGCFEYRGELGQEVECIFVLCSFMKKPCVVVKEDGNNPRYIPVIGLGGSTKSIYAECCYDIVYNIIPKLVEQNVRVLVIKEPDSEYEQVADLLPIDIRKREYNSEFEQKFLQLEENNDKRILDEIKKFNMFGYMDGYVQIISYHGTYMNYFHGERYTVGNPDKSENTLYLAGPCIFYGGVVSDECTIGSCLRDKISEQYYIKNCGGPWESINFIMRSNTYQAGDLVILMPPYNSNVFEENGIVPHSIIEAYKNLPDLQMHVNDKLIHCNHIASKCVAEEIYNICIKEEIFGCRKEALSNQKIKLAFGRSSKNIPAELHDWLSETSRKYKVKNDCAAGAIVMNCNPFTLGHRYLIERAAEEVDTLYVFVLEEDKSFFDFKSRYYMVKMGVSDLDHVIVIPSGKYIISTNTMPGYFNKEEQPFVESDAVTDLYFFAQVVAEEFNIHIRFAGEEPRDEFTRKYNETMKRVLPEYGIEFCEMPRKQIGETVISASLVRKYMAEHNYESVKELVMPCVYEFLKEHFFDMT